MLLVSDEGSTDSVSPAPSNNSMNSQNSTTKEEKKYYCQRCLNHSLQYTRKGHKPFCKYATCSCSQCRMVEERRQLNNMLSRKKVPLPPSETVNGRRIRDPKCARCSAHGLKKPLRGHKKSSCPYYTCTCQLCNLVENRRSLMAKQIKLRRDQQRKRAAEEAGTATGEERLLAEEKENDGIDVEKRVENPSTTVVVPKPMLPIAPQLTLPSILPSISMPSSLPSSPTSLQPSAPAPPLLLPSIPQLISSPSTVPQFPTPLFLQQFNLQQLLLLANLSSQMTAVTVPQPSPFLPPAMKPFMSLFNFPSIPFQQNGAP